MQEDEKIVISINTARILWQIVSSHPIVKAVAELQQALTIVQQEEEIGSIRREVSYTDSE